jgi:hypothetical protein
VRGAQDYARCVPPCIRHIQFTASGLMRVQDDPAEYFEALNMLSGKPSAIRGCRNVILEDKSSSPPFLIETSQLDIIQGTTKNVGGGVDVRIHQPDNRANSRRWRREDAALCKHFARIKYHPESGRADDCNTRLEKLAPRCIVAGHMIATTASKMNRLGGPRLQLSVNFHRGKYDILMKRLLVVLHHPLIDSDEVKWRLVGQGARTVLNCPAQGDVVRVPSSVSWPPHPIP